MKKSKNLFLLFLFFVITIFVVPNNVFAVEKVLYEGIGKYNYAVAGSSNIEVKASNNFSSTDVSNFNNSISTTGHPPYLQGSTTLNERKFVKDSTGFTAIDNDSTITNISGSYLNIKGTAKKTYLYIHTNVLRARTDNMTILVTPKGEKKVLKNGTIDINYQYVGTFNTSTNYTEYAIIYDVSDIVKSNGKGYYYVSLVDAVLDGMIDHEEIGWGMISIDEDSSYHQKYMKINYNSNWAKYDDTYIPLYYMIDTGINVDSSVSSTIDFAGISLDSEPLENSNNQIYLVVGSTETKINSLKDSSNNYYFSSRSTNPSFLYSVCDTTRKTSYKNCYEFDIFNGKLPTSLLNGNNNIKFKIAVESKGGGAIQIPVIGLGVDIQTPELTVISKIEKTNDSKILNTITVKNVSQYNSCSNILTIPIDKYLKDITDIKLSDTNKGNYRIENGNIIVTLNDTFKPNDELTITYKGTKTTNAAVTVNLDPVITYYPSNGDTCSAKITGNSNLQLTAKSHSELSLEEVVVVPNTGISILMTVIAGVIIIGIGVTVLIIIKKNKKNNLE